MVNDMRVISGFEIVFIKIDRGVCRCNDVYGFDNRTDVVFILHAGDGVVNARNIFAELHVKRTPWRL